MFPGAPQLDVITNTVNKYTYMNETNQLVFLLFFIIYLPFFRDTDFTYRLKCGNTGTNVKLEQKRCGLLANYQVFKLTF